MRNKLGKIELLENHLTANGYTSPDDWQRIADEMNVTPETALFVVEGEYKAMVLGEDGPQVSVN
ncbi:MAG: hypothetical protein GY743_23490 [Planctomycetaceae bacterium]|nr:hypothetical protein [Planctomycetaceae bacterium]